MWKKILSVALILAMLLCLAACTSAEDIAGTYKVVEVKYGDNYYTPEEFEKLLNLGNYMSTSQIIINADGTATNYHGDSLYWDKSGNTLTFFSIESINVVFDGSKHSVVMNTKEWDTAKVSGNKLVFGSGGTNIVKIILEKVESDTNN